MFTDFYKESKALLILLISVFLLPANSSAKNIWDSAYEMPPEVVVTVTNSTCFGDDNGTATVTVTNGVGPFTYVWSNGDTTSTIDDLSPGDYTVTVYDALGDSTVTTTSVSEPDPITGFIGITPASCVGVDNGIAVVTVNGGTGPYTYMWSDSMMQDSFIATNLPAGPYSVTVTDANNCTATFFEAMYYEFTLELEMDSTNSGCSGGPDGTATALPSGGTEPYSYVWSNTGMMQTITGLAAGSYVVTVTDDNGCMISDSVTVVGVDALITSVTPTPIPCDSVNGTGSATINIITGTSVYQIIWTNEGGDTISLVNNTTTTTNTLSGLSSGNYNVKVIDANGCESVQPFTIDISGGLTVTSQVTTPSCPSCTDGSIEVMVNGGTPAYMYLWNTNDTTSSLFNLGTGTYVVTVTDQNGCTGIDSIPFPTDSIELEIEVFSNETCAGANDGVASVSITGGIPPFDVTWSCTDSTGQLVTGLAPGPCIVTVEDAAGNIAMDTFTILPGATVSVSGVVTNANCAATNTGSIDITPSGGTLPYTYSWDPPQNGVEDPTNLLPGNYVVTVTDSLGCFAIDSFIIGQDSNLVVDLTVVDESCEGESDGSITINSITGTPPYTIDWADTLLLDGSFMVSDLSAGTYTVAITDSIGCTDTLDIILTTNEVPVADFEYDFSCYPDSVVILFMDASTTDSATIVDYNWVINDTIFLNGPVVSYTAVDSQVVIVTYTVTTGDSCSATITDTIVANPISIVVPDTVIQCPGDAVTLNPEIDSSLVYTWEPADNIAFPSDFNPVVSVDSTTTFTLTVTRFEPDTCKVSYEIVVFVPDSLDVSLPNDTTICDLSISIDGTTANGVSYSWMSNDSIIGDGPILDLTPIDTQTVILVVTDQYNCPASDTMTIIEGAVNVSLSNPILPCLGDSVTITPINLDMNDTLTFQWLPDSLFADPMANSQTIFPDSPSTTIIISIENQYNCNYTDTLVVAPIDSSMTADFLSYAQCDSLIVTFENLNAPYFALYYGDSTNITANSNEVLTMYTYPDTGTYTVMLVPLDSFDFVCPVDTVYKEIQVYPAPLFDMGYTYSYETCSDTAIIVFTDTSSHVGDDIVQWDWVINGDSLSGQTVTITYDTSTTVIVNLTVTTGLDCTDSLTDTIDIEVITVDLADSLFICPGDTTFLNPNGNQNYIYSWTPVETLTDPTAANPGAFPTSTTTYTVEISNIIDVTGDTCRLTREIVVVVYDVFPITATEDQAFCFDTTVIITASSPNGNSYEWSTDPSFDPDSIISMEQSVMVGTGRPAIYYVRVIDENGCANFDSVVVANYEAITEVTEDQFLCLGESATLTITSLIDDDSLDIIWSGGPINGDPTAPSIEVSPEGSVFYVVQATNQYGCSTLDSIFVEVDTFELTASATANPDTIFLSQSSDLEAMADGVVSYEWSPNSSLDFDDIPDPVATPDETTEYTVTMENENGCPVTRTVTVTVLPTECGPPFVFMPNAFTPNRDGLNDILYLRATNITDAYFEIYNRWGQMVFVSNSLEQGWDGTFKGERLPPDVYGYYLRVRCLDQEEYYEQGNVSLLR